MKQYSFLLNALWWLLLLIASYFTLFHHLNRLPLYLWDESWYALNAIEMIENGKILELYLLGEPDVINEKPPFFIWNMIVFIKLFGFNELGIRLASAVYALLTVVIMYVVAIKVFANKLHALIIPFILISSIGYVSPHTTRTGDTDAAIAFWIFAQCICFFYAISAENNRKQSKYVFLFFISLTFGCLTKGVAGGIAVPGLVLLTAITKQTHRLFFNKGFYLGVVFFIVCVMGYYLTREILTPGYLLSVWKIEFVGRGMQLEFLNTQRLPFYHYFKVMITADRYMYWLFLLPISIVYILRSESSKQKTLGMTFVAAFTSVAFILSISTTKTTWYDASLYPLMAVIIGTAIIIFLHNKPESWFISVLAIFFIYPFTTIVIQNTTLQADTSFPLFLKQIRSSEYKNDSIFVINSDPNFMIYCYAKQDQLNGNFSRVVKPDDEFLLPGKFVLTEKEERRIDINNRFVVEEIMANDHCNYYKIISLK
jgi:4-amino-4-deoxy-L-arabinose transferase-like glycosyltransferase